MPGRPVIASLALNLGPDPPSPLLVRPRQMSELPEAPAREADGLLSGQQQV
jgi:hypothetical protein